MKATYCYTCGEALIPKNPPRFDVETGEKRNEICPSGRCDHYGGPYHRYAGGGLFKVATCVVCGSPEPWYD